MEYWEFGVLDIHNPKCSTLTPYFSLLEELQDIPGNILELGVAKGSSLITTGLILQELNSEKSVIGVDTFSGFPELSSEDMPEAFLGLQQRGLITESHYLKVLHNWELVKLRGGKIHPSNISTSQDFSSTSLDFVEKRIQSFKLSNRVRIHQANIVDFLDSQLKDETFSLVLLDVDLYLGYSKSLDFVFDKLTKKGVIYLDEYYSLKFPGPRLAVNEFIDRQPQAKLEQLPNWLDFERWIIRK